MLWALNAGATVVGQTTSGGHVAQSALLGISRNEQIPEKSAGDAMTTPPLQQRIRP
jgi:hypothetical protein